MSLSLSEARQIAQERVRARRHAAAARFSEGSSSVPRRLNVTQQTPDEISAARIRAQQDRELRNEDPLQRRQPGHIPSGGKRRKSRKVRGGRKSHKSRKSRKVRGGRKLRKVRGGSKSSKVRRSRR